MIDVSLLNEFWNYDDSEAFEVRDEVKSAYYIFIKDFCPLVSAHWRIYLGKLCKNRDTASFVNQLTKSDEAFTYWLIKCLIKKVEADIKFINEHGIQKWNSVRKKGKGGKHDSNVRFDEFIKIFQKVDTLRNNEQAYKFWMDIFFNQFFKDYKQPKANKTDDHINISGASNKMIEIPKDFN